MAERELKIRNQITDVFLRVPDDNMYFEVLNIVLQTMDSKYGVFGYIDEKGALIVPSMTRHIWDKCQVPDKTIVFPRDSWGHSTWPEAIRRRETIFSNKPSMNTPQGHISIRRHISLPIIHRGEAIGLIQVANKESDYTKEDVQLLERIGETIAPVLQARLQRDRNAKGRALAEEQVKLQQDVMKFSTPLVELWEGIILLPMVGILDSGRAKQLTESVLRHISQVNVKVVIMDVSGIAAIDTKTANHILRTVQAVRLMGSDMIITGIRPDVALTLAMLGIELSNIVTRGTLREGLEYAFSKLGLKLSVS
jgi:anti-anti-sigma regulatory factor